MRMNPPARRFFRDYPVTTDYVKLADISGNGDRLHERSRVPDSLIQKEKMQGKNK
jgi:hypothetical protein